MRICIFCFMLKGCLLSICQWLITCLPRSHNNIKWNSRCRIWSNNPQSYFEGSEGANLIIKVPLGFKKGTNGEGHLYLQGLNNKKRPLQIIFYNLMPLKLTIIKIFGMSDSWVLAVCDWPVLSNRWMIQIQIVFNYLWIQSCNKMKLIPWKYIN